MVEGASTICRGEGILTHTAVSVSPVLLIRLRPFAGVNVNLRIIKRMPLMLQSKRLPAGLNLFVIFL